MPNIHVFSAKFKDEEEAMEFSEPYYDENDNALCRLWDEIDFRTDPDFVETIFGLDRYEYLRTLIGETVKVASSRFGKDTNTIILIFDSEGNSLYVPKDTHNFLKYCGTFRNVAWG